MLAIKSAALSREPDKVGHRFDEDEIMFMAAEPERTATVLDSNSRTLSQQLL